MKIGIKDLKEVVKELDIVFDFEYIGGCYMVIQVDFVFNKFVYVVVKLVFLKGRVRLQLSRYFFLYWFFVFYEVLDDKNIKDYYQRYDY